jgi:hypothetical protein
VSVTVFARNRTLPDLHVIDQGTVHRVSQMFLREDGAEPEELPYGAECGHLVTGCAETLDPVSCLECIAGQEALIEALKNRWR